MMTDVELLEQHRGGSETAFAELVRRHIGWVWGVARRRLQDSHEAQDVSQAVFVLLHKKAPRFSADGKLIGWLHRATWYATEVALRNNRRRQKRETEAAFMQAQTSPTDDAWHQLAPLLDQLIDKLSKADREAILLRYFRDLSFAEVGREIGTTEEAARKRVDRAIEKLRKLAAKNDVTISAMSLAAILAEQIRIPPPPGLFAAASSAAAVPSVAAASTSIVKGATLMMTFAKLPLAAALLLTVLIGGTAMWMVSTNALAVLPGSYPRLSPFTAVAWKGENYQVQVNGAWYELVAINDVTFAQILDFAKKNYPQSELRQKRIDEDLVEVLSRMGHTPRNSVNLQLKKLEGGEVVTLQNIAMTEANRKLVWQQRNGDLLGPTTNPGGVGFAKLSPFSAVQWQVEPRVQVDGIWYELLAIDDIPAKQIIEFDRKTYGSDLWQKRFDEDLVEVLTQMGHAPGKTVKLELRDANTSDVVTLPSVPMTQSNRDAVWKQRNQ